MNDASIRKIEASLGGSLPDQYREFLLAHGDAISKRMLLSKTEDRNYSVYPYCTVSEIVSINTGDRDWMETSDGETLSLSLAVLIADNGGGDYWYVYRDSKKLGVWYWDHETQLAEHEYPDLESYFGSLDMDVQPPEKPWWRFW